jgi:hypothetical protein
MTATAIEVIKAGIEFFYFHCRVISTAGWNLSSLMRDRFCHHEGEA